MAASNACVTSNIAPAYNLQPISVQFPVWSSTVKWHTELNVWWNAPQQALASALTYVDSMFVSYRW